MVIRERVSQEPPPVISFDEKDMRYKPLRHDEPMSADMEPYAAKLYGFAGEQVEIRGGIELETTFGESSYARTIQVLYMVLDMEASYNVIRGRLMHWFEDNLRIDSRPAQADWADVNVLDLDLDRKCKDERERPLLVEDLKETSIGTSPVHKTKIGTTLMREEDSNLISFL
ncbi:hypothetical protein CR513_25420, partial [Mucuna pruriens]